MATLIRMVDQTRNLLLVAAIVLFTSSENVAAYDECPNSIKNVVVYEGTQNTILGCGLGPSAESWTVRPTSQPTKEFLITNFTSIVSPALLGLYAVNQSGITIRNGTIDADGGPISTAGLYHVYLAGGNRDAAKVAVIRSGPNCSCVQSASNGTIITCTIIYADFPIAPMNPVITCTDDGQLYTGPATKTLIASDVYVYNSTTIIQISNSSSATYDCCVTFTAPAVNNNPNYNYFARNQPNFTANVTVAAYDVCPNSIENVVVYEGTQNTILGCGFGRGAERWAVRSTSLATRESQITDFTGSVSADLLGLYAVNQSGLIIRNATIYADGGPISTAGLYQVYFADGNRAAAKVAVIRSGVTCSCAQSALEGTCTFITCTIIYADFPVIPMNPVITCTDDGQVYTGPVTKTIIFETFTQNYVYNSTTIIQISNSSSATYDCRVTFTAPAVNGNPIYNFVARNEPNFTTSVTVGNCSSQDLSCTKNSECRAGGTNLTDVYDECVVKAELYAKCDNSCDENFVCGVVVTLRNDSRWLIHDPLCNDNKCEMDVFDASCMTTGWKLLTERRVIISGVGDYVQAGNGVQIGQNVTDCSESCKRMMNLP